MQRCWKGDDSALLRRHSCEWVGLWGGLRSCDFFVREILHCRRHVLASIIMCYLGSMMEERILWATHHQKITLCSKEFSRCSVNLHHLHLFAHRNEALFFSIAPHVQEREAMHWWHCHAQPWWGLNMRYRSHKHKASLFGSHGHGLHIPTYCSASLTWWMMRHTSFVPQNI